MHILYVLKFSSGKNYVGQTTRDMKTRFLQHKNSSLNGNSKLAVHCAWRKHGEPDVDIIDDSFESSEDLHNAEKYLISSLNTIVPNGYNLGYGGETAPSKNPMVAKKISEKAIGRKIDNSERRSEIATELWQSKDYRNKMSESLKKSWDDEKREKVSIRMKEFWKKRKESGWKMPEKTKEKISNKEISQETKDKMSESAKRRGQNNNCPHARKVNSDKLKSLWADPEKRAERVEALKKSWVRRKLSNNESGV